MNESAHFSWKQTLSYTLGNQESAIAVVWALPSIQGITLFYHFTKIKPERTMNYRFRAMG